MINLRCAAWRAGIAAATQSGKRAGRRPGIIAALVVALITASTGVAAGHACVAVAASPDVQILVDAGSVTKDSRGVVNVWTKTRYASPQTGTGTGTGFSMQRT